MKCLALLCQMFCLVLITQSQTRQFIVRVVVPISTPADASVFIAGNSRALGDWSPGGVRLKQENDSVWSYHGVSHAGEVVEFKITRGSWDSEAIYVDGSVPPNTVVQVLTDTVITLRPLTWHDISPARAAIASTSGITGLVRYHRALAGKGLNYPRDIVVWLPPSYEATPAKRYSVLYMHDGQNVFDPKTSFLGYDWRADEVADSLIKSKSIEEIIIVGIYNSPDRIAEYSDTPLGRSYASFVVTKVKPLIDSLYRTNPSPEHTVVMGSSMGGLISFYFLVWYPEVFSKAGCLSTSIWQDGSEEEFTRLVNAGAKTKPRIYMDVGELEPSLIPGNRALYSYLKKIGFVPGKDIEFFYAAGAPHNEQAWAARLWRPLCFLFGL